MHETVRRQWFGVTWLSHGRYGRLPPLLVETSCGDAGSRGLVACL